MLIYIKGNIGSETAYNLYKKNIVLVKKQFPQYFIKNFEEISENIADIDIEKYPPDVYIREMCGDGLFAALWELCEEAHAGCSIDLEKVPVRQEIVEILELFNESPYEVPSKGSFLIFSNGPVKGASLIGFTNKTNSRTVNCGGRIRFLTPPQRQAKDIQNRKGE